MSPIQRILQYVRFLKEICNNFERAEQKAVRANVELTKEQIYKRDIFTEALSKSQNLAEYINKIIITRRIIGFAVSRRF